MWESHTPLVVRNSYFFHYKYVIAQGDKVVEWERGVDRIADMMIMPEARSDANYDPRKSFFAKDETSVSMIDGVTKHIAFNEKWEKMWVSFMVF